MFHAKQLTLLGVCCNYLQCCRNLLVNNTFCIIKNIYIIKKKLLAILTKCMQLNIYQNVLFTGYVYQLFCTSNIPAILYQ